MARRKEREPLQKVSVNLFIGDFGILRDRHGRIGASKVIREMVRGHLTRVNSAVAQRQPEPTLANLQLDEILK